MSGSTTVDEGNEKEKNQERGLPG